MRGCPQVKLRELDRKKGKKIKVRANRSRNFVDEVDEEADCIKTGDDDVGSDHDLATARDEKPVRELMTGKEATILETDVDREAEN